MKIIRDLARLLAGAVFIFSGFVKGVDPAGSAIKFTDYFEAFHLGFLQALALPLAFLFPLLEFLIGISLLFNLKPRAGIWGLLFFMLFFTPLTLMLALFNPVSDCGCFGDALVLTNWQTFFKNIFLLALALFLFAGRKKISATWPLLPEWGLLLFFLTAFITFSLYSYNHLPPIDFRPYRIGTHIPAAMSVPDDAPRDIYQTTLIYEKNGEKKEFTTENFPWRDTTWKFVDQHSILIRKGYTPPIHDFSIVLADGEDVTSRLLSHDGYIFLLVSPDLARADRKALAQANALSIYLQGRGIPVYLLTATPPDRTVSYTGSSTAIIPASTDETTCKTIIRANPGLVLIKEGTILGKWHYHDFPDPDSLEGDLLARQLTLLDKRSDIRLILLLISGMFLIVAGGRLFFGR